MGRKRKTQQSARAEEELEGISRDIAYEISMMLGALATFRGNAVSVHVLKNLAIEGFLLHLRNLRDLFYRSRLKSDDVRASDFFSDPGKWESIRPPLASVIKEKSGRLNRQLAHLSYSRLRLQKSWGNLDAMAAEMIKVADTFLQSLPQERRRWFQNFWKTNTHFRLLKK